ncbi:hypothetical protein [Neobacillus rhizosphaerae]|uniref:hypothetical protein n=1 Tax=Neobacillus rhizosphaerae TaxID=2880965 RepID=UPI00200E3DD7|nr:hypothetical protein [Neobacillus rhizosphaerae]
MRRKKYFSILVLSALILGLVLSACGNSETTDAKKEVVSSKKDNKEKNLKKQIPKEQTQHDQHRSQLSPATKTT